MIRNRLLPTHIFAMMMMGVGIFLLISAWVLHQETGSYPSGDDNTLLVIRNALVLFGTAIIIASIGLLTLQKWAIRGFLSILWLGGIALAVGIYELARNIANEATALKALT